MEGPNFFTVINSVVLNCKNLCWIDLSHNYLTHINYDFSDFVNLKTLYLHANYIAKIEVYYFFILGVKINKSSKFEVIHNSR